MSIYDENAFTYNGRKPHALVSREQVTLYMRDPRYRGTSDENDPQYRETGKGREEAYIRFVEACLCLTDDEHTGANANLEGALAEGDGPQFQDLANTLGGMRDFYRDMEEARVDQASPLSKCQPLSASGWHRRLTAQRPMSSWRQKSIMGFRLWTMSQT